MRTYTITDEGDEMQVALYENGFQVGGAVFPDEGDGMAFEMALAVCESWKTEAEAVH